MPDAYRFSTNPKETMRISLKNCLKYFVLPAFLAAPFLISGHQNVATNHIVKSDTVGTVPVVIPVKENTALAEAQLIIDSLDLDEKGLSVKALEYALKGYNYLQSKGMLDKDILSICDFSQSSKKKRLYIIDVRNMKLILNTYVAHGRNSGAEYAKTFSNKPESLMSSLGFYRTKSTYQGGHGLSLKIQGLEKGYNDKADFRNIVVHGSEYVGADFLRYNACCGRSYGCPAIPAAETPLVIKTIKDGSCIFIYHPSKDYLKNSKILNGSNA